MASLHDKTNIELVEMMRRNPALDNSVQAILACRLIAANLRAAEANERHVQQFALVAAAQSKDTKRIMIATVALVVAALFQALAAVIDLFFRFAGA